MASRCFYTVGTYWFVLILFCGCDNKAKNEIFQSQCLPLSAPLVTSGVDEVDSVVPTPDDDAAYIYASDEVKTFELNLSDENLAFLDNDPTLEQYVEGTLSFNGTTYGPVGIRYKGSRGAWASCTDPQNADGRGGKKICPKLNMKISFNEYNNDLRFYGMKKLQFHAMNLDKSMMRERLGYDLYREMGLASPRVAYIRLYVNGHYNGVFLNVEYIDGVFVKKRFEDGKGNLYKSIWPSNPSKKEPPAASDFLSGLRTNEDESPSMERIVTFSSKLISDNANARAQSIRNTWNTENLMTFFAVDRTIRADDGPVHFYCSSQRECGNHNFYIYEELNRFKLWIIPWDLDNSFLIKEWNDDPADRFLSVGHEWDDHQVHCRVQPSVSGSLKLPGYMPPSCDPFINSLGCYFHDAYDTALKKLLDGPFSQQVVDVKIASFRFQLKDAVEEAHETDTEHITLPDWEAAIQDLEKRVVILRNNAHERITTH
ncbi:MAG: CotH kinase family protein [Deltaproteobacteria bacterium]|nr:CotH kinase family protein [Deltaproteobacteria bacterium]